jgi:hypothetical protein
MKNLPMFSASSQAPLQLMKPNTWSALSQLTPSEIDLLRQSKKSIADYVQKELLGQLKQRHLEHLLNEKGDATL